jgi:hypothetical protein
MRRQDFIATHEAVHSRVNDKATAPQKSALPRHILSLYFLAGRGVNGR